MKNRCNIILLAALLALPAAAQDTLVSRMPKAGYFYNNFVEASCDSVSVLMSSAIPEVDVDAKYFYTDDTLTVYGIAAAIYPPWQADEFRIDLGVGNFYEDTTYDGCSESLRLYRADPGTLTQLGEDLAIHLIDTSMTYTGTSRRYI